MQIGISGHHLHITDALRQHVEHKLAPVLRHSPQILNVNVILSVEKSLQKAEATLHIKGTEIFAAADNKDLYHAIGNMADKLQRQVQKYKDKSSPEPRSLR